MARKLTPLQGELLLDLFEHCMILELCWQRKEQAQAADSIAADHMVGEWDAAVEKWDRMVGDCATHGVPAERVAFVIDTYLPTTLQSVEVAKDEAPMWEGGPTY